MSDHFPYLWQKFDEARGTLMLPHLKGEAADIAEAYWTIHLATKNYLDPSTMDEEAAESLAKLHALMNTDGIQKPTELSSLLQIRAAQLTDDERAEFSELVSSLTVWFYAASQRRR